MEDRGRCTLVLVRCSEGESEKRTSVWGRGLGCPASEWRGWGRGRRPHRGIKGGKSPEPVASSGQGLKRGYVGSRAREGNRGGSIRVWSVPIGWGIQNREQILCSGSCSERANIQVLRYPND